MDEVEIVITPRLIERVILGAIVIVLIVLLVIKWNGSCPSEEQDKVSANVVAEQPEEVEVAPAIVENVTVDKCANEIKDVGEVDIDCGGSCSACAEYKACNVDRDCASGLYCFQHIKCLKPTCNDGIKNQNETNVDCGGVCKGFFWDADKKCHDVREPSGELEIVFDADIERSPNSGSAIIEEMELQVINDMGKDLSLIANIYARDEDGDPIFENKEGEIVIYTQTFSVASGATFKKTIDFKNSTRSTLAGIKSSDPFQIYVELKDSSKKTTVTETTWVNE